jgi:predicted permease
LRRRPFWYLRRKSVQADVDEELDLHLELRIDELRTTGLSIDEARAEALRQFGDLEATRAYCRRTDERKETAMHVSLWLQDLAQDVRIALRSLLRVPGLALTIVVTVGAGAGATAAIFGAIDAALLRPLPYADPGRLVRIYTDAPPFKFRFSVADYLAFREQQTQFAASATFTDRSVIYSDGTASDVLTARVVSSQFFGVLGIRPEAGRDFDEPDEHPGATPAVMLSHAFWTQRLGGRREAIGRPITLDGIDHVVVGVLPVRFGPLERRPDVFVAQQFTPPRRKGPFLYSVVARLRDGTDRSVAAAELRAINTRLFPIWQSSYQDDKATWGMDDLRTGLVGNVNATAGVALAAVGLVWLIACANASNLLIARVMSRRQELAVRTALGASRGRVVRYLLAESAVLAAASMALAGGVTWGAIRLVQTAGANYFPRTQEIALDARLWMVLAGLALCSAAIFGLIPAMHGAGGRSPSLLRSSDRSSTGSRAVRRVRRALVGSQFAIATPLLVVAGLLLASLNQLRGVDLGFDERNLVTASIRLPAAQYQDPGRVEVFWSELERRAAALPGVAGVAFADGLPPNGVGNLNNFDLEDHPAVSGQSQPVTAWVAASPEYFGVLGLTLLEGRLLDDRDALTQNLESVVVDRAWAKRFFPGGSALGKRFHEGGCTTCPWTSVVGVVTDVKYLGLAAPDDGTVYSAIRVADSGLARFVVIRTHGDPSSLLPAFQRTVRDLDPSAPISDVSTVEDLVASSIDQPRSLSLLVASFALAALLLSVVGIYGVMGYYVQQHLRDISIRMALGGSAGDVLRLVLGQGMRVVAIGVACGLAIAVGFSRLVSSLFFGVSPLDPAAFAAAGLAVLVVALAACLLPARRAMRLQPASVLRGD